MASSAKEGLLAVLLPYRSSTTRFKNIWFMVATLYLDCVVNFFLLLQKSRKMFCEKIYFDLDQVLKLVSNFYYLTTYYNILLWKSIVW